MNVNGFWFLQHQTLQQDDDEKEEEEAQEIKGRGLSTNEYHE